MFSFRVIHSLGQMELVFFVNVMEVSRHCQVVNQSMRVLIEKKRSKDIVSVFFCLGQSHKWNFLSHIWYFNWTHVCLFLNVC